MRRLYAIVLLAITFSYPITAVIFLRLIGDVSTINFLVKGAIAAAALVAIFVPDRAEKLNQAMLPLIVFFGIYGLRLLYDVLARDILAIYQTPLYVLGYFFGLTILPILMLLLSYRPQDLRFIMRGTLISLMVANVLLLFHALTSDTFVADSAFSGRVEVAGNLEGTAVLSPLQFGIMGAMLLAMLLGIFSTGRRFTVVQWAAGAGALGIAVANLLFSASRGPVLALGATLVMLVASLFRQSGRSGAGPLRQRAWVFLGLLLACTIALIATSQDNVFLVDRFTNMFADRAMGGTEERDFIYAAAWHDFTESPLIGSSYVTSFNNTAPHNIVLEALMSTGVTGSGFFAIALLIAVRSIWRVMQGVCGPDGIPLALAAVSLLTLGLTSSSVGQTPELWCFISLVTIMGSPALAVRRLSPPKAAPAGVRP